MDESRDEHTEQSNSLVGITDETLSQSNETKDKNRNKNVKAKGGSECTLVRAEAAVASARGSGSSTQLPPQHVKQHEKARALG